MYLILFFLACEDKTTQDTGFSNNTTSPTDSELDDTDDSAVYTVGSLQCIVTLPCNLTPCHRMA